MAYGQAPFMRFYESKNGQDTRFLITNPASGCMLYYDSSLNKFVNSNSLLFDPVTFTFSVHQIATDSIESGNIDILDYIRFYEPFMDPVNYYSIAQNSSNILNITYNGTPIGTIGTTGITTLVPQKLQTTLTTTNASFFIPFVPLSSTQTTGQVFGTDGGLTYNPSNNSLIVINGSVTADNFTGLASSASSVTTFTAGSGTFFPVMSVAGTGGTDRLLSVDTGLSYEQSTDTLNIGTIANITDRVRLCILNDTISSGQLNGIQLGYNNSTNNSWFMAARYNTTATDSIFAIHPYGTSSTGAFYITTGGTVVAPTFQGSLTGSATLIDTTAVSTNATYYLPFVPLATTQSGGQVLGTDADITYNPSTNTLTVPNIVGSLTGSATLIDTTGIGAGGLMYIPLVPLATTQSAGQVVYTDADINFNSTNNTLTASNIVAGSFTGSLTGDASLIDTTNNTGGATQFLTFVPLSSTQSAGQVLGTSSSLGYVPSTGTLTATVFSGSLTGSATLIDTTAVGTNANYFIPFVPLATTQSGGQVLGTDAQITYNPSTNTLTVPNEIVDDLTVEDLLRINSGTSEDFDITNNTGTLIFNNAWSALAFPLEVDGNGGGVTAYNIQAAGYPPTTAVELDTPTITALGDQGVLFEANTANDYSSIPTQTGTTFTIVISGFNPNRRELTFSFGVSSTQDLLTGTTGSINQSFAPTFSSVTATRNGSSFTAFNTTSSTASGTSFAYNSTNTTATYNIRQPLTQYTIKFVPTNSETSDTYVFTIPISITYTSSGTGYSWANSVIERNPSDFTYSFTRTFGFGVINLNAVASPAGTSMISAKTLTKDFAAVSSRTLACDFLQAGYVGLVGEYTITGTTGTLLRCFRGDYDYYEIQLRFTSAPTNGTTFTVQLATGAGTASTTGYNGNIVGLGSSNVSTGYGSTTGAILFSTAGNQGVIYTAKIYSPNVSRTTTFQASNIGTNATQSNVCHVSTGFHTVTTSYPSMVWTASNSINASILFRGFN
jgi:hypothetical protein